MATKYFTWTKGDRNNALEWMRNDEHTRAPKGNSPLPASDTLRAALPLARAVDSSQEAIIPLATPLMELPVPLGRQRSHTAPPTPICEPPPQYLVELPGSVPLLENPKTATAKPGHIEGTSSVEHLLSPYGNASQSRSIPPTPKKSDLQGPHYHTPRAASADMLGFPAVVPNSHGPLSYAVSPPLQQTTPMLAFSPRPSPLVSCGAPYPTHNTMIYESAFMIAPDLSQVDVFQQDDAETVLLQQIAAMRAAHDSHLASLRSAHDMELASHLAYIAFLERRQSAGLTAPISSKFDAHPALTIDTSSATHPLYELPALDSSATTLQSSEPSLNVTRPPSQDTAGELVNLKRQLSLMQREKLSSVRTSQQYEQLRDTMDQRERRITQLKQAVKKAAGTELILRNTIDGLEVKLAAANNERLDVLEGYHEACSQLKSKLAEPRNSPSGGDSAQNRSTTQSNAEHCQSTVIRLDRNDKAAQTDESASHISILEADISSLRCELEARDMVIDELRGSHKARKTSDAHNSTRFFELQDKLESQEAELKKAEVDRDSYKALLHRELQRQTKQTTSREGDDSSLVDKQAAAAQLQSILAEAGSTVGKQADAMGQSGVSSCKVHEEQLEHCLDKMIKYKLVIRKLKQDIRMAHSDLSAPQPMVPDQEVHQRSRASTRTSRSRVRRHPQGGLGITSAEPIPQPTAVETSRSTSPCSLKPRSSAQSSRSVANADKELPKPPSSPASRNQHRTTPAVIVQRPETRHSLSDSIIASYLQPRTPEQIQMGAASMSLVGNSLAIA